MRSAHEQDTINKSTKITSSFLPLTPRRSMEEVWRNITMSSPIPPPIFHHHPHSSTAFPGGGVIFQDFLAGGGSAPPPPPSFDGSIPLPTHPATALCLNTAPPPPPHYHHHHHISDSSSDNPSHNNLTAFSPDSPADISSFRAQKRAVLEQQMQESFGAATTDDGGGGTDRRQKRMIKNRESAARSRARKQAYTNELELEVAHLQKENAMLRKQYDKLRMAMDAQVSTKRTLQRSSTAPF